MREQPLPSTVSASAFRRSWETRRSTEIPPILAKAETPTRRQGIAPRKAENEVLATSFCDLLQAFGGGIPCTMDSPLEASPVARGCGVESGSCSADFPVEGWRLVAGGGNRPGEVAK
ncbi:hypothetical protein DQ04_16821000 [Trypanosoma grayi]|uniref:hypothetical protein n=1 Tax=Trypanosoma grayi TaxID=71804 RepID=UPI0004F486F1|nr:hypothetical protein DQ04_16821000 [Trypanosoma grayi]KEG05984.1 hypothetical protein DQ04_16821000 [Trypanosoma grayi]